MKKTITIIVIALAVLASSTAGAYAASGLTHKTMKRGGGYITKFYDNGHYVGKVKTARKLRVKTVKERKLTAAKVNNRRGKYILVEIVDGKCVDNNGNGKTSAGYYIRYKGAHKGDKFRSYLVYEDSKYIDDITIRVDRKR